MRSPTDSDYDKTSIFIPETAWEEFSASMI